MRKMATVKIRAKIVENSMMTSLFDSERKKKAKLSITLEVLLWYQAVKETQIVGKGKGLKKKTELYS